MINYRQKRNVFTGGKFGWKRWYRRAMAKAISKGIMIRNRAINNKLTDDN